MKHPISTLIYNNKKFLLTWIRDNNLEKYHPVSQVYGIVFNNRGKILIARVNPKDPWAIPGGKPEPGETIDQTLKRELEEEVDIKVSQVFPLGAQKVELESDKSGESISYQLRCVAALDKVLPQTPDPANSKVWERKFVPATKITKYVKWGKTGGAMFKDATDLYKKLVNLKKNAEN